MINIIGGVLSATEPVIVVVIVWFIVITIGWADIVRIIVPRPTPLLSAIYNSNTRDPE
ncbi:MAG: hypothetical protein HY279_11020 [Nitrospinae bacterium]|nr:hypothetical protein [Nitrospinota bacterium]